MNESGIMSALLFGLAVFLLLLAIGFAGEASTEYGTPTINGVPCEKVSDEKFICRITEEATP